MRNDMESLNPGKACAQAAHAQRHADSLINSDKMNDLIKNQYRNWCNETHQCFGSTICLSVDGGQLDRVTSFLTEHTNFAAGKIHDPTYPIMDGEVLHLIPVDTCGWVFGDKNELNSILQQFDLFP